MRFVVDKIRAKHLTYHQSENSWLNTISCQTEQTSKDEDFRLAYLKETNK